MGNKPAMKNPGGPGSVMTCRDAIDMLADYLEAALGPGVAEALERHLRDCRPCQAYLNTYRKTRELAGRVGTEEMPPEMKEHLRRFLLEKLRQGKS
jgi:Putative zinc-finger